MTNEWTAVLRALRTLLTHDPRTKRHLDAWTTDANLLMRQIRTSPGISNALDEIVWHFLSDADIRVKDPVYGETQRAEFERWLKRAEHFSQGG